MKREYKISLSEDELNVLIKAVRYYMIDLQDDLAVFKGLPELPEDNYLVRAEKTCGNLIIRLKWTKNKKQVNGRDE